MRINNVNFVVTADNYGMEIPLLMNKPDTAKSITLLFPNGRQSLLWEATGIPKKFALVASTNRGEIELANLMLVKTIQEFTLDEEGAELSTTVRRFPGTWRYVRVSLDLNRVQEQRWLRMEASFTNSELEYRNSENRKTDIGATYHGGRSACVCGMKHQFGYACNWADTPQVTVSAPYSLPDRPANSGGFGLF